MSDEPPCLSATCSALRITVDRDVAARLMPVLRHGDTVTHEEACELLKAQWNKDHPEHAPAQPSLTGLAP